MFFRGAAWMALFSQNMTEIGIQLAAHDSDYDEIASNSRNSSMATSIIVGTSPMMVLHSLVVPSLHVFEQST